MEPVTVRRPHSVTAVGLLFVAAGIVGTVYHASEIDPRDPLGTAELVVLLLRVVALVAGIFVLRGADWGRWVALAWMVLHVGLGVLHSWSQAIAHLLLLAAIGWALLRPPAAAYFRRARGPASATSPPAF
jgi:hypothetical protein